MKVGVRTLYQNGMYGSFNKLIFVISFVNLLPLKLKTPQVSKYTIFGLGWNKVYSILQTRPVGGQRKAYGDGVGMKRPEKIYPRREDCGSCGRRVGAIINIWMQNRKHDMPPTQLRELQKRIILLLLKIIKETSFVLPN